MSRLLTPMRFCATCKYNTCGQRLSDRRMNGWLLLQQHRQYRRQSSTQTFTPKSTLWLCGVGAGVALVFGLKSYYTDDRGNTLCDGEASDEKRISGKYHEAIGVSRDLVERIKVGLEVGTLKDCMGSSGHEQQHWNSCKAIPQLCIG